MSRILLGAFALMVLSLNAQAQSDWEGPTEFPAAPGWGFTYESGDHNWNLNHL